MRFPKRDLTENQMYFVVDFDSQEYAYNETLFSEITLQKIDLNNVIGVKIDCRKICKLITFDDEIKRNRFVPQYF